MRNGWSWLILLAARHMNLLIALPSFLSAPWLMTDGIYFFSALAFPRNPATTSSSAYVNEDRFVAMATREATSFDNLWGEFK
jgi:hypothetical protein